MNFSKKKFLHKKHFIFDLDGVLFDTLGNMKYAWKITCKKNNLKIPFSKYKKYIGLEFNDILKKLGIKKNFNKINEDYFNYSKKLLYKSKIYSNVKKTLNQLLLRNKILSIVTSKKKSNVKILIKKLGINFFSLNCPNYKHKGKPNSDSLIHCIKKSKINKKYCVYVGDMPVDYKMAKNSKVDFVYANYGYGPSLKNLKKIKNIKEILEIYI